MRAFSILFATSMGAVVGSAARKLEASAENCGGGSTGMAWCPKLGECIQPWAETCPINGTAFVGPTKLLCDNGGCGSDEKCSWKMGSAGLATYYFGQLDGDFDVPEGCVLNCTGCDLAPANTTEAASINSTVDVSNGEKGTGTMEDTFETKDASRSRQLLVGRDRLLFFATVSSQMFGFFLSS
jgi:hypothetical protein